MNLYAVVQTDCCKLWQTERMETKRAVRLPVPSELKSFQKWLDKYPESMSGFERESLAAEAMLGAKKAEERKAKEAKKQRGAIPKKRKAR
jgi:hypothetical protein